MGVDPHLADTPLAGVREFEQLYPGLPIQQVAERYVAAMTAKQRRAALIHAVIEVAEEARRSRDRGRVRVLERFSIYTDAEREEMNRERIDRERAKRLARKPVVEPRADGWTAIVEAMEKFRSDIRLEFTSELLNASFSLGNGESVTWGAATIAQHKVRIALLSRSIEGGAHTLTLHEQAIEMIAQGGVSTLRELEIAA